jgi:hypothetical protein
MNLTNEKKQLVEQLIEEFVRFILFSFIKIKQLNP